MEQEDPNILRPNIQLNQEAQPAPAQTPVSIPAVKNPLKDVMAMFSSEKYMPIVLAFFAVITGIILFFILGTMLKKPQPLPPVTIIVTPTPAPTPVRTPTALSTTSAFLQFSDSISTFSSELQNFQKDDPSLSPPSLVLPLGFSN